MSRIFASRWENSFNPVWIMIVFLLIGPFLLILGSVGIIKNYETKHDSTSVAYGTVVDVEEKRSSPVYGFAQTSYIATVEPEDDSIFDSSELRSVRADYCYAMGERVRIYYDPSDPSTYYIQHADPIEGGRNQVIAGAVVLLLGIAVRFAIKICKD